MKSTNSNLGKTLRQRRLMMSLTLAYLAGKSKVSASHLGRIEGGERFPSARILRRLAEPLGFEEHELFALAGYLSPVSPGIAEESPVYISGLDPYVAQVLAQESVEVQRAALGILTILKSLARSGSKNKRSGT
ncbi:helix-turn-helix domain-containing protein [Chloroflexota bacterium]